MWTPISCEGKYLSTDCDIRWYKSYNYQFGRIPRYTQKVSQIINHAKEVGVPFVASPPTIMVPVYTNCTDSCFFYWVTRSQSPVMMDECFQERLGDASEEEFDYNLINDGAVVDEYSSLFTPQQSITEYAASIQLATMPQSTNNPYRFHLETYKHLINFAESDPKASCFLGSLFNDNLQKMADFTMANGLAETPIVQLPTTHAFSHCPTAVITSSHCPNSRKRKCKRSRRAGEYFKKKKNTPRGKDKTGQYCSNVTSETGSH
jgi:hypothetical protein